MIIFCFCTTKLQPIYQKTFRNDHFFMLYNIFLQHSFLMYKFNTNPPYFVSFFNQEFDIETALKKKIGSLNLSDIKKNCMFAVEKYKFCDVILLFFKYKQIKDILRY
jgi:hypothetical protein